MAHRIEKKQKTVDNETNNTKSNSKKEFKEMLGGVTLKRAGYHDSVVKSTTEQQIETTSIQEPHTDFILNSTQYFTEDTVDDWVSQLKKYFPNTGEYYHFMIKYILQLNTKQIYKEEIQTQANYQFQQAIHL
jgi:hypothetical protein